MLNNKVNETKNLFNGLNKGNNQNTQEQGKSNIGKDDESNVETQNNSVIKTDYVNVSSNVNNSSDSDTSSIVNDNGDDLSNDNSSNSSDLFTSLLVNDNVKEEYVRATHYFRKDQLADITKFAKKAKKGKNEFMRDVLDLVFEQLKKNQ